MMVSLHTPKVPMTGASFGKLIQTENNKQQPVVMLVSDIKKPKDEVRVVAFTTVKDKFVHLKKKEHPDGPNDQPAFQPVASYGPVFRTSTARDPFTREYKDVYLNGNEIIGRKEEHPKYGVVVTMDKRDQMNRELNTTLAQGTFDEAEQLTFVNLFNRALDDIFPKKRISLFDW
jgi:hypothetical protein